MINKEVIIFQIENMLSNINKENLLLNGGYIGNGAAFLELMANVLALLKEQEAVKPLSKVRHGANAQIQHFCGNCRSMLHGKPKFCSECGRSVKWND